MNELDIYNGGDVQTYSPSQPLAPAPDWKVEPASRGDDYTQYTGGGQMVFGQPLPAGISIAQVTQHYKAIGSVFVSDFLMLGHNVSQTQRAVKWFLDAITNPPAQEQRRHNYNLYEHTNDPLFQAFANYASDNNFSAKFVSDACYWVTEAGKKLNAQSPTEGSGGMPRMAQINSDPTTNLTDAQYQQLVDHNNRVQAQTMATLQHKWGSCFKTNIELAQAQLNKQTPAELAHLDRYTGSWPWTHMFNTVELLTAMYDMAIGAGSIGASGADISKEIASYEAMLKIPSERARYMRDSAMQARLRELYSRRGN